MFLLLRQRIFQSAHGQPSADPFPSRAPCFCARVFYQRISTHDFAGLLLVAIPNFPRLMRDIEFVGRLTRDWY